LFSPPLQTDNKKWSDNIVVTPPLLFKKQSQLHRPLIGIPLGIFTNYGQLKVLALETVDE